VVVVVVMETWQYCFVQDYPSDVMQLECHYAVNVPLLLLLAG